MVIYSSLQLLIHFLLVQHISQGSDHMTSGFSCDYIFFCSVLSDLHIGSETAFDDKLALVHNKKPDSFFDRLCNINKGSMHSKDWLVCNRSGSPSSISSVL